MSDLITLVVVDQEPRVDSRLIAEQLGVEHESFRKLVRDYQPDFEEFGILRFEIAKPPQGSIGGRPEKYALLNEDQSYLGLTYTQNTPQARDLKKRLVRSFAEHRKALPGSSNPTLAAQLAELLQGKVLIEFESLSQLVRLVYAMEVFLPRIVPLAKDLEKQCGRAIVQDLQPFKAASAASTPAPAQDTKWRVDLSDTLLSHIIDAGPQGADHRDLQRQCWSYRRATRDERNAALNRLLAKKQIVQRPLRQNERAPRYVATSMEVAS